MVDTSDLVHFRYEIKNNLFGRGFTITNSNTNRAYHDADDTMYLVNKNWTYEDDFYKSSNYANRFYALFPSESNPPLPALTGQTIQNGGTILPASEVATKFKPPHSHWLPGDVLVYGDAAYRNDSVVTIQPSTVRFRISADNGGNPSGSVIVNIDFSMSDMQNANNAGWVASTSWIDKGTFLNSSNTILSSFDLDTTKYYWLILSDDNCAPTDNSGPRFRWYCTTNSGIGMTASFGTSSNSSGGSGWSSNALAGTVGYALPVRRSHSFFMYDPKAMQAVSSGLTAGLSTNTLLTDASSQVTSFDSMYRFMQQQTYNLARPRTTYSFPTVTAPNIPPFPGDPIIISDDILGLSTTGNQVVLTTCGDMSYQWGNQGSGGYNAPTKLSINAIGVHARYR